MLYIDDQLLQKTPQSEMFASTLNALKNQNAFRQDTDGFIAAWRGSQKSILSASNFIDHFASRWIFSESSLTAREIRFVLGQLLAAELIADSSEWEVITKSHWRSFNLEGSGPTPLVSCEYRLKL